MFFTKIFLNESYHCRNKDFLVGGPKIFFFFVTNEFNCIKIYNKDIFLLQSFFQANCTVSVGLIEKEQKVPIWLKHKPSLQKGFRITNGCLEDSRNHNLKEFKLSYFKPIK